jgi:hypothetical protein
MTSGGAGSLLRCDLQTISPAGGLRHPEPWLRLNSRTRAETTRLPHFLSLVPMHRIEPDRTIRPTLGRNPSWD